jgi:hypothetical protein
MTEPMESTKRTVLEPSGPLTSGSRGGTFPRGGVWLALLSLTLLGYALFGKGFAYLGVPPLFIGEIVLFLGVVLFVLVGRWRGLLEVPAVWPLLLLLAWGLLRTWPDLSVYGKDALRDAVIWGYSAFALVVFGLLLAQPQKLVYLVNRFRQFSLIFPICIPFCWFAARHLHAAGIPRLPGADVPFFAAKGGDTLVHAAGILAFGVIGLGGAIGWIRLLLLAGCVVLAGTYDRAGLLSFLMVFAVCFLLKPLNRSLWRLVLLGICGLLLLAATNLRLQMPGREREISFAQFVANLASVTGTSHTGDLEDTKQWRLEWWHDIVDYTVHGKYFWTGKGFGINLADDDDYQVEEDHSLRNPHNGHLTTLARGGVPGLLLWVSVQFSWACSLFGAYVRSQRAGNERWARLFLFLLAYWMAFMINAAFDVYLEGPMGGIWFWTVFGVGLAALWLYQHHPTVLDGVALAAEPTPVAIGGN